MCIGILAHVDAGKTTLAESILYESGSIRRLGRVDHKDAFFDTDKQERDRGITIFSKQARFRWHDMNVTLLDTPGHVDFSAEMERTLQALDYAVLVVSGADGVQGHVTTLWRLLERYHVPVFLFINKMDQPDTDAKKLLAEVRERLDTRCVAFTERCAAFYEDIAVCDEELLERYLEAESTDSEGDTGASEKGKGTTDRELIDDETIVSLIAQRKVFPCFFGSALKVEGVTELLDGLNTYTKMPRYGSEFGARVYKISRDAQGNRLTHVKITGGTLKVKQTIRINGGREHNLKKDQGGNIDNADTTVERNVTEEKIDQIRIYSGEKYTLVQEVKAGDVCALTGPAATFCGEGLGVEKENTIPLLEPVMTYRIVLPEGCDVHQMYSKLCQLEEEEPQLHVVWKEQVGEIQVQLMGEVQIEILRNMIADRFGVEVTFDEGSIVYKETIASAVEGVGHYEPLRHYAEVHLLLEPGEPDSGLQFHARCSEDVLDRNWQRLILTHLEEKEHLGVLTGSPITDMQITLVAGRAHLKHTEGGDFRQATYRAVRQGLCKAQNVLLEPVYAFRLELPAAMIGRGMTDLQGKAGKFGAPEIVGEYAYLTGTAPVSKMAGYQAEVLAYSGGRGRLYTELKGYAPCHDAEAVIERIGYEAERDMDNPCSSVFCAHGAGFVVEWDRVEEYMHLEQAVSERELSQSGGSDDGLEWKDHDPDNRRTGYADGTGSRHTRISAQDRSVASDVIGQDEIDEIMKRTYGAKERKKQGWSKTIRAKKADDPYAADRHTDRVQAENNTPNREKKDAQQEDYLLVDGYNIIFAWDSLSGLAQTNLDSARGKLMDILSNYQGYRKMRLILVFDAYKVKGSPGSAVRYHNIDVVYTKEAETADQYIEKVTHKIGRKHRVRVATSDGLEQLIIMGAGAIRVSARELREEVMAAGEELRQMFLENTPKSAGEKTYLLEDASDEVASYVDQIKKGIDNDGAKDRAGSNRTKDRTYNE
ncbi:MAG: TetM/TetW/TetO/TetS family tetracycline resistance ribosomal protection protein [Eubacterium sp.]|nr:TetM/TetW/TetO/TetS family tetracycline resistance ribosomal protection protein [Eubacterium sp.]